ncbi:MULTISPECIES: YgjV family protein [Vibrio]|uniref:YgjV family protein n=1 Tax=Vibrio mediterranei TaxID=689 RepID=A0A3G4VI07_9VIBR|nr:MULTISPECIES: YgjV family protein [Vibrio]AYV23608.1 YgjV family protein [Vibrio mediterranei]MCF4172161.1 YgjV family protein [Vibrio sp. McD22-P3]
MIDLFSVGQALGFLSFGLGISTFYQKSDRQLKILMFVFNINHLLHYLLLGSTVSAVAAGLSAARTLASIHTRSKLVAAVFIVVAGGFGYWIADGVGQLWSIIGTVIGTFSMFVLSGVAMRVGFLVGATCWLINNVLVGSIGGTLLEATLIVTNLVTIYRLRKSTDLVSNESQT